VAVDTGVIVGVDLDLPLADEAGGDGGTGAGVGALVHYALALVPDGPLLGSGTIEVVDGFGGGAELPVGGSFDGFLVAVAKGNGGGLGIIKDETEDDLFGMVALAVLGIILEEVSATAGEVNSLDFVRACLGGALGAVVKLVNLEYTGAHRDGGIVVVVGGSDGEGAVLLVGLLAGGALLGPVLTGLDASYEVMVAHDGGLELVSLASTVVDLETDLRGGRRESEARN